MLSLVPRAQCSSLEGHCASDPAHAPSSMRHTTTVLRLVPSGIQSAQGAIQLARALCTLACCMPGEGSQHMFIASYGSGLGTLNGWWLVWEPKMLQLLQGCCPSWTFIDLQLGGIHLLQTG